MAGDAPGQGERGIGIIGRLGVMHAQILDHVPQAAEPGREFLFEGETAVIGGQRQTTGPGWHPGIVAACY